MSQTTADQTTAPDPITTAASCCSEATAARDRAIIEALLHGASQRDVARRAGIAVATVRNIMTESGIRFSGSRYERTTS